MFSPWFDRRCIKRFQKVASSVEMYAFSIVSLPDLALLARLARPCDGSNRCLINNRTNPTTQYVSCTFTITCRKFGILIVICSKQTNPNPPEATHIEGPRQNQEGGICRVQPRSSTTSTGCLRLFVEANGASHQLPSSRSRSVQSRRRQRHGTTVF